MLRMSKIITTGLATVMLLPGTVMAQELNFPTNPDENINSNVEVEEQEAELSWSYSSKPYTEKVLKYYEQSGEKLTNTTNFTLEDFLAHNPKLHLDEKTKEFIKNFDYNSLKPNDTWNFLNQKREIILDGEKGIFHTNPNINYIDGLSGYTFDYLYGESPNNPYPYPFKLTGEDRELATLMSTNLSNKHLHEHLTQEQQNRYSTMRRAWHSRYLYQDKQKTMPQTGYNPKTAGIVWASVLGKADTIIVASAGSPADSLASAWLQETYKAPLLLVDAPYKKGDRNMFYGATGDAMTDRRMYHNKDYGACVSDTIGSVLDNTLRDVSRCPIMQDFQGILNMMHKMGAKNVIFLGGDKAIHPDLKKWVRDYLNPNYTLEKDGRFANVVTMPYKDRPNRYGEDTRSFEPDTFVEDNRDVRTATMKIKGGKPAVRINPYAGRRQALLGGKVYEIKGSSRFETAEKIAKASLTGEGLPPLPTGTTKPDGVVIARAYPKDGGHNMDMVADSISAGTYASRTNKIVLLSETGRLHESTKRALQAIGQTNITIAGGTQAISPQVENELKQYGTVRRVAGSNRFETSLAFAKLDGLPTEQILAIDGFAPEAWASGLASGAHVKANNMPVILYDSNAELEQLWQAHDELGAPIRYDYFGKRAIQSAMFTELRDYNHYLAGDALNGYRFYEHKLLNQWAEESAQNMGDKFGLQHVNGRKDGVDYTERALEFVQPKADLFALINYAHIRKAQDKGATTYHTYDGGFYDEGWDILPKWQRTGEYAPSGVFATTTQNATNQGFGSYVSVDGIRHLMSEPNPFGFKHNNNAGATMNMYFMSPGHMSNLQMSAQKGYFVPLGIGNGTNMWGVKGSYHVLNMHDLSEYGNYYDTKDCNIDDPNKVYCNDVIIATNPPKTQVYPPTLNVNYTPKFNGTYIWDRGSVAYEYEFMQKSDNPADGALNTIVMPGREMEHGLDYKDLGCYTCGNKKAYRWAPPLYNPYAYNN